MGSLPVEHPAARSVLLAGAGYNLAGFRPPRRSLQGEPRQLTPACARPAARMISYSCIGSVGRVMPGAGRLSCGIGEPSVQNYKADV